MAVGNMAVGNRVYTGKWLETGRLETASTQTKSAYADYYLVDARKEYLPASPRSKALATT